MALQVVSTASLVCSFGTAPSPLTVMPTNCVESNMFPAGNIQDHIPISNIKPFGMCNSTSNPQVIAATSAALGVLTPMPCIPVTPGSWQPGSSTVLIANQPALNDSSTCACAWAGVIKIVKAGQTTHMIA